MTINISNLLKLWLGVSHQRERKLRHILIGFNFMVWYCYDSTIAMPMTDLTFKWCNWLGDKTVYTTFMCTIKTCKTFEVLDDLIQKQDHYHKYPG